MVITLLSDAGKILKGKLTYEMLQSMVEKINNDLNGAIQEEKEELIRLFNICEDRGVSAEKAVVNHTKRITSYTNTALFYTRNGRR